MIMEIISSFKEVARKQEGYKRDQYENEGNKGVYK